MKYFILMIFIFTLFGCQTSSQKCANEMLETIKAQNLINKEQVKITPELIDSIGNACRQTEGIEIK